MATHKSETAPWSSYRGRHLRITRTSTARRGVRSAQPGEWRAGDVSRETSLNGHPAIYVEFTERVLAAMLVPPWRDDVTLDLIEIGSEFAAARRTLVEIEARAEFDRLASRHTPTHRSIDVMIGRSS